MITFQQIVRTKDCAVLLGLWKTNIENANPSPLFRFAGAATGRMDAGVEAAGVARVSAPVPPFGKGDLWRAAENNALHFSRIQEY